MVNWLITAGFFVLPLQKCLQTNKAACSYFPLFVLNKFYLKGILLFSSTIIGDTERGDCGNLIW